METATGDVPDIVARLKAVLPARWFGDDTPVLDAVLAGLAAGWSTMYAQLQAARTQARVMTATGGFLDLIASDFFGPRLRRKPGQGDDALRTAIGLELRRERGTRAALAAALTDATGNTPHIFEPLCPADTGAWNQAWGYGTSGGWGSLALPFQCLVTIRRPAGGGIPLTPPWGGPAGYGIAAAWADLSMLQSATADSDIYTAAAAVMPTAAIAWVNITN
jgi:hypothetical protein